MLPALSQRLLIVASLFFTGRWALTVSECGGAGKQDLRQAVSTLGLNDPTWETVSEDSSVIEIVGLASIAGVNREGRRKRQDK